MVIPVLSKTVSDLGGDSVSMVSGELLRLAGAVLCLDRLRGVGRPASGKGSVSSSGMLSRLVGGEEVGRVVEPLGDLSVGIANERRKDILYKWCRFEQYIILFLLANGKLIFVRTRSMIHIVESM